jgi:hypothetical protein
MSAVTNQFTIAQAKSFVKFDGTKLKLEPDLNIPNLESVRVLSILGKARLGKSTFLNALVSMLTGSSANIFKSQTGIEHCTYGIDYCFIPEHNLLLLDSQGLANGDARHDPALLLFLYLVSDVIIFNDSKILQNEALKLIEPVCAFMTYIEDIDDFTKPHLMFRLSDGKLVKDVKKNLANVMAPHEDQYQSIRESIAELFQDPLGIVKTESLSRDEETMLDNNDYMELLHEKQNGFHGAIQTVLDMLVTKDAPSVLRMKLPAVIDMINNNQKISIDKLDVVHLLAEREILSWINDIPHAFYSQIEVDGTQDSYVKNVDPRSAEVKKKVAAFKRRFKSVSTTISTPLLKTLEAKLQAPITAAVVESEAKALELVKHLYDPCAVDHVMGVTSSAVSLSHTLDETLRTTFMSKFYSLKTACQPLYDPVKRRIEKWIREIDDDMFKVVTQIRREEQREKQLVINNCREVVDTFAERASMMIDDFSHEKLVLSNDTIIGIWIRTTINETESYIRLRAVKTRQIEFSIVGGKLKYNSILTSIELPMNYDLIADIYSSFVDELTSLAHDDIIRDLMVEKKELLMLNKLYMNPVEAKQLYTNNPEIEFIYDGVLLSELHMGVHYGYSGEKIPYMTKRTWLQNYEPLYTALDEKFIKKGLCKTSITQDLFETGKTGNISFIDKIALKTFNRDFHMLNLNVLSVHYLQVIYCKMCVKGLIKTTNLNNI